MIELTLKFWLKCTSLVEIILPPPNKAKNKCVNEIFTKASKEKVESWKSLIQHNLMIELARLCLSYKYECLFYRQFYFKKN